MIKLKNIEIRPWAVFKVFFRNGNKWVPLQTMQKDPGAFPFSEVSPSQRGIYVQEVSQMVLPSFGTATLLAPIGNINTVNYNFKEQEITAPDLLHKQIYITKQLGDEPETTVFWGVVDYQKDIFNPGSGQLIIGSRNYKASDLLFYVTSRATMEAHGYAFDQLEINRAPSVPVYNGRMGRSDLLQGNKAISVAGFPVPVTNLTEPMQREGGGTPFELRRFTFDGLGGFWSDKEVIVHAIHTGQRNQHLIEFKVDDPSGLLNSQDNIWPVTEGERSWSFIRKILRFQRGAGVSYFTFDVNTDGSPKDPKIRTNPVHELDFDITLPETGSQENRPGAATTGTTVLVDITGDQRNVDSFFSLGGVEDFNYDRIEVTGEKIQVLCQLGFIDNNLIKLWSDDEQTNFDGLDADAASHNRYDHIYRYFGIPRDWNGVTGNGDGGAGEPFGIYFFCNDDGSLTQAENINYLDGFINPATLKILPDIPLHSGIDPETGVRYVGLGSAVGPTMRSRILFHERIGSDSFTFLSPQQRLKSDGVWIGSRGVNALDRTIGGTDMSTSFTNLIMTCCIELPYRSSVSRGLTNDAAEKTKRIRLSGSELWIGAKGSMFEIPEVDTPKRFAATTILKDDRNRLAYIAFLAENWYIKPHQAAKWALKDFCIGGTFEAEILSAQPEATAQILDDFNQPIEVSQDQNLVTITYPKIGELVINLNAGGVDYDINAPVTAVRYDNTQGVTFFQCDWGELEL